MKLMSESDKQFVRRVTEWRKDIQGLNKTHIEGVPYWTTKDQIKAYNLISRGGN